MNGAVNRGPQWLLLNNKSGKSHQATQLSTFHPLPFPIQSICFLLSSTLSSSFHWPISPVSSSSSLPASIFSLQELTLLHLNFLHSNFLPYSTWLQSILTPSSQVFLQILMWTDNNANSACQLFLKCILKKISVCRNGMTKNPITFFLFTQKNSRPYGDCESMWTLPEAREVRV